jgi:TRAP transporter TAXI family solute receptor
VKKRIFVLGLVVVCSVALVMSGTAFAGKFNRKFLKMVSGPEGGSWYPLGSGMMRLVEQATGISTSNGPGGGVGNCKAIQRGNAELGWTYSHTAFNAYNGKGKFKKPHKKLRYLASLYPGIFQVAVPKSSKISSFADLKNKRIVPGKVGFTGTAIAEVILKAYGITFKSIKKNGGKVDFVGYADAAALMKDGHTDAYMAVTSCPQSTIIDLNFRPGVRFLGIDPVHMKKILSLEPGLFATVIPKTAYKGMDKDVPTMGTVTCLVVSQDVEDDVAYAIVKAIFENLGELAKIKKKAISQVSLEKALQGCKIPVHPGAVKYYKEHGLKVK